MGGYGAIGALHCHKNIDARGGEATSSFLFFSRGVSANRPQCLSARKYIVQLREVQ